MYYCPVCKIDTGKHDTKIGIFRSKLYHSINRASHVTSKLRRLTYNCLKNHYDPFNLSSENIFR